MSKRAGPPLFELLRKQSEAPAAAPPQRREPDPQVPWTGAGVTRAERSAATLEDQPRNTGELRVPMNRVYMAVALTLALIIGAWAAGYSLGTSRARQSQIEQAVASEQVVAPVRTPVASPNQPADTTPAGVQNPAANAGAPPAGQARPNPAVQNPPPGSAWVVVAGGTRSVDPRSPGVNYLELATLPADQALDAIDFMASKGVRVVGVPVDSGGRNANNPDRYRLVSLGLAVPSGQFSTTQTERRDHQRLVATIGAEWKRERRGGSDFSQTLWSRYDP